MKHKWMKFSGRGFWHLCERVSDKLYVAKCGWHGKRAPQHELDSLPDGVPEERGLVCRNCLDSEPK